MISFIVPSRNRPDELLTALNSLRLSECGLEALVWLDDDDPKLKEYQELFISNPNVKLFIKKRIGYLRFHEMMNFLCTQAKYDWFFEFNDDAYMDNPDWFNVFRDSVKNFHPKTDPVVLNIWGQGVTPNNLFPIVSRRYFEILGHFSMVPNCDDWIRIIGIGAKISYDIRGIAPKHRKYGGENILIDQTYQETERDRTINKRSWNEKQGMLPKELIEKDIKAIIKHKK